MIEEWLRPVEQVTLSGAVSWARVVGVVAAAQGAGVSTFCRTAAELTARSGTRTLIAELSGPLVDGEANGTLWTEPSTTPFDFDETVARVCKADAFRFNRADWLRSVFADDFAGYEKIVVDLPPLLGPRTDRVNPAAAAAACDAVVLLCARGASTPDDIGHASSLLRSAGANLVGAILNDRGRGRHAA